MTVPFNVIPSSLRAPLFYAEVDRSAANQGGADVLRTLLVGQGLGTGVGGQQNVLTRIVSASQAGRLYGKGSMLHRMAVAYFAGDSIGEVWAIGFADDEAAVKQTKTIEVVAVATRAGVLPLYIAGKLVNVTLATGLTKAQTAAAINTAINAPTGDNTLPCTSATDGVDTVTITARNGGKVAGKFDVRACYLGSGAGETLPEGLELTFADGTAGATDPSLTAAIAAMGDEPFEFIAWPYTYATEIAAIGAELNDSSTGRWGPFRQLYGHAFGFYGADAGALATYGTARNDGHITVFGLNGTLDPWCELAAAYTAAIAVSIRVDPARPLQTLPVVGVKAPALADRFTLAINDSLLHTGIATSYIGGGVLRIQAAITTYQKNAFDDPDTSLLDSETLFTLATIMRRLRSTITSNFPRHKLVNDGTKAKPGSAVVSPSQIRNLLIAEYRKMEADALVENVEAFKQFLIVERNSLNPNRVDVLFPPDLVNALRVFALLNQFRLQYAAA